MTVIVNYDAVPPLATRSEPHSDRWTIPGLGASGNLARRLQVLYHQYVERYKALIPDAERTNVGSPWAAQQSAYPTARLLLDGVEMELPIDPELYTNLFDLYSQYGWPGINAAERSLLNQHRLAGTDAVLRAAGKFFLFTRNVLALLIREVLLDLEAQAAHLIFDRLGQVNRHLSATLLSDLAADYTPASEIITDEGVMWTREAYKLRTRAIADSLYADMKRAVERRTELEELVSKGEKLAEERQVAERAAADEAAKRGRGWGKAVERLQRENQSETAQVLRDFDAAQSQLIGNMPFAAVVLPGLRKGFGKQTMETVLVKSLHELAVGIDAIAAATRPDDSRIRALMAGVPERWQNDTGQTVPLDPDAIARLYPLGMRLELDLIEAAAARSDDDAAMSWLIEPRTWGYVRATATIEPGSFADIVLHQWVQTIVRRERETAAGRAARTRILRLGAATLGLLMLVFPPLALSAVVAGVAVIVDAAHTAATELAAIDDGIRALLPALADAGSSAVAEIGFLAAQRPQIITTMTTEGLTLLATLAVGQIRAVGELLVMKGFFDDSRTLIEAVDEG